MNQRQKQLGIQELFGYKPSELQAEFHRFRKQHAYTTNVAHRRWGKTEAVIMELFSGCILNERRLPIYQYLAPTLKQAKQIAWDKMKFYGRNAKDNGMRIDFSETEKKVIFKHRKDPAITELAGWEEPETLRGPYTDGMGVDEAADMKKGVWGAILAPRLADRKGWAAITGTVKGVDQFFDFYRKGVAGPNKDPFWGSLYYPISKTIGKIPWLDDYALSQLRSAMTPTEWRQEMECDWNASSDDILIPLDLIMESITRNLQPEDYDFSAHVMGIDVSGDGGDKNVLIRRKGLATFPKRQFTRVKPSYLARQIMNEVIALEIDALFIDDTGGYGKALIEALRDMNCPCSIFPVKFNEKANDPTHYFNIRSEMWFKIKEWMDIGGSLIEDEDLIKELAAPHYFHDNSRLRLESKKEIKKRLGYSPDSGDALALTFAYPVVPKTMCFSSNSSRRQISVRNDFKLGL